MFLEEKINFWFFFLNEPFHVFIFMLGLSFLLAANASDALQPEVGRETKKYTQVKVLFL